MPERYLFQKDQPPESVVREHLYRYEQVLPYVYGVVIDAGCGGGYGSELLAERADEVIGIDNSGEAIDYAGLHHQQPNITFIRADLNEVLPDGDCLVLIEALEHLQRPEELILAAKKEFELIAISTPVIPTTKDNPWHLHDFSDEQIRDWFRDWHELHWEVAPDGISGIGVWSA